MNWIENLNNIYNTLNKYDLTTFTNELKEAQYSGGTGGEIFLIIATKLKEWKTEEVYPLIRSDADKIIEYGKSIGYLNT